MYSGSKARATLDWIITPIILVLIENLLPTSALLAQNEGFTLNKNSEFEQSLKSKTVTHENKAWLAFGDLRGHIEPCGCDPATDLGGVRRIDAFIQRERSFYKELNVFCLGNLFELKNSNHNELRSEYILRSLAASELTATLYGPSEIKFQKFLQDIYEKDASLIKNMKFVISNAKATSPLYSNVISTSFYDIYGYYFEKKRADLVEAWDVEKFKSLRQSLGKNGAHRSKILLFRGPQKLMVDVAKTGVFDAIISGNQAPDDKIPSQEEKMDESKLQVNETPLILQVPLGGQGILRGGILQNAVTPTLKEILGANQNQTKKGEGDIFGRKRNIVSWLTPQIADSARISRIFAEYEAKTKLEFTKQSQERLRDLAFSPFVGADACQGCHQKASESYRISRHARAMQTLIEKGKHEDSYCVSCHSVGSKMKGGFVSVKDSAHLGNVQCESCHGPRKEHSLDPSRMTENSINKGEKVCLECHNEQHSPRFEYKSYWDKIKHSL